MGQETICVVKPMDIQNDGAVLLYVHSVLREVFKTLRTTMIISKPL